MWLVVGLGNPGSLYEGTRHNTGFMVLDLLAERFRLQSWGTQFLGEFGRVRIGPEVVALLKPHTYMNLSGDSVRLAFSKLGVDPAQLVIVHDEAGLPPGRLKVSVGGGDGGHKGVRSVAEALGTRQFVRVRVGIGRPTRSAQMKTYVLSAPEDAQERAAWLRAVQAAADAVEIIVRRGVSAAMNHFNGTDFAAAAPDAPSEDSVH